MVITHAGRAWCPLCGARPRAYDRLRTLHTVLEPAHRNPDVADLCERIAVHYRSVMGGAWDLWKRRRNGQRIRVTAASGSATRKLKLSSK